MNHILDSIKTEAGKRLWTKINDNYGSSVWGPVGDGIVKIEAEVEARIIKLLEANCNCHTAMVRGYVKKFVCPAHGFIARIKADSNV